MRNTIEIRRSKFFEGFEVFRSFSKIFEGFRRSKFFEGFEGRRFSNVSQFFKFFEGFETH